LIALPMHTWAQRPGKINGRVLFDAEMAQQFRISCKCLC